MNLINLYKDSFSGISRDIWFLAFVMLVNRSGAMVLPFLGIYLNQELNYGLTEVGLIMTFFGIGSFLGAFSGGILTDKIGFFQVQLWSLVATSIAFLSMMVLRDFWMLCGGVFMISFLADHFRPASWTAVEVFSKKENLVRSISLIRLAINLGYAIGPFVGGIVAGTLGYYMLFIINASSVLLAAGFFYLLFRNKQQRVELKEVKASEQLPWNDTAYLAYLLPFTLMITVFLQLIYSVPIFFKNEYLFDEFHIGILMAINGGMIFLIEMPIIYILEKRKSANYWVFAGGVFIALAFAAFIVIPNELTAALSFVALITFGEIISFPFSSSVAIEFSNDQNRGKYMGLYTMTFSIASIIAPGIGLYISENFGFNKLWGISVVICMLSSIWILALKKTKNAI